MIGGESIDKNKRTWVISLVIVFVVIVGYRYYMEHFSNEGVFNNITQRNGYSLTMLQEQLPIELFIEPEWIPFTPDERKQLNMKLLELDGTSIYLDNVWNKGDEIYFSFHTKLNMNYWSGEFLYNGIFHDNGAFSFPAPGEVILYDKEQNSINLGGHGEGPGADFSFGIRAEDQHRINQGLYVKYSRFILYEYKKKRSPYS